MKKHSTLYQLLVIGCLLLAGTRLPAQNKLTLDKVYKAYVRNSGAIMQSEEIKGYFVFYQTDKVDRHTNEYSLQIMDENLNKIKDVKFTDDKDIQLLESSFNGDALVFLFYNEKEKTLEYRIYGLDGRQRYVYTRILDKKTRAYLDMYLKSNTSEEGQNKNIFDIDNKGFISVIPVKDGSEYTYSIDILHSDLKKQLTYDPSDDIKFETAQYLGSNDSLAVFEVVKKERLMGQKMHSWLLGINLINGKKAFEISTEDQPYKFLPMSVSTLQGGSNYILMGTYYDKDDRVMADKTLGLAVWTMNNKGQILAQKYNSWASDISKYLKTNERGKVDNLGYIYFHKILQTENGKVFAIGEGYKKGSGALGVISSSLLGGGSLMMTVTEMVVLQFNKDFAIEGATIYEKNNNHISLPGAMGYYSAQVLALVVKAWNGFDYSFTLTDRNHSSFVVGYTDYERSKDYKGMTFHSISYFGSKFSTDKINLKSEATSSRILPGKPGSVMILEYYKKDKKLEMRLEKMN